MQARFDRFSYIAASRTFVTDASDIAGRGTPFHFVSGNRPGVTLVGRTGRTADYMVVGEIRNDGDVSGWNLAPTPESEQANPACKGTKMLIAND
jgi:hypothetical protein